MNRNRNSLLAVCACLTASAVAAFVFVVVRSDKSTERLHEREERGDSSSAPDELSAMLLATTDESPRVTLEALEFESPIEFPPSVHSQVAKAFMAAYPNLGQLVEVDGVKLCDIAIDELEGDDLGDVSSALRDFAFEFEGDLIRSKKHLGCDRLTTEQARERFEWNPEAYFVRAVPDDEDVRSGRRSFWVLPDNGCEIRRELKNISIDISGLPAQQARIPRPDNPYVVRWEIKSHGMLEVGYDALGRVAAQRGFSWIGAPY